MHVQSCLVAASDMTWVLTFYEPGPKKKNPFMKKFLATAICLIGFVGAAQTNMRAGNGNARVNETLNVMAEPYNAKCDGVTDDSAAFKAVFGKVESAVSGYHGTVGVYIPPGNCLIKTDVQLLGGLSNVQTAGLKIFGAGREVSRITFQPPNSGATRQYLFHNNNAWQFVTVEGITFIGDNAQISGQRGYTQTGFLLSNSTGEAQNWTFVRDAWKGFDRAIELTGKDTNSEFTWDHCGISGYVLHFLYVDPSVGDRGDQFLNYNFRDTQFEVNDGSLIDMAWGGSINIYGGSWIHINRDQPPTLPFINLGQANGQHAFGTQRLYVNGVRVEHRAQCSGPCLLKSNWVSGSITFDTIDDSPLAFHSGSQNWKMVTVNPGNNAGPNIVFRNCQLMGRHEYVFSSNSFNRAHTVTYEDSTLVNHTSPADFIIRTGNTNPGGEQLINFVRDYFPIAPAGSPQRFQPQLYSSEYGFDHVAAALGIEHVMSFKDSAGKLPGNASSVTMELPLNALITKIVFYSPTGAVTDGNPAKYTVHTSQVTPRVLATLDTATTTGAASKGFYVTVDLMFKVASDSERMLVLQNNQPGQQPNSGGYVIIYYIGG